MDYKKNQKYFRPSDNTIAIILFVIGGIVFVIGLARSAGAAVVGMLLLGVGFAITYTNKKNVVTDAEYDTSVTSNLKNIRTKALSKLGIDEDEVKEVAPISFDGYVYNGASQSKQGADGLWRTNKYESVTLFFSEHEVHCYTYTFDTTQQKQTEATDVYFYKDIVSVSTASNTVQLLGQNVDYEYFKLTTAGGTALSVSLRDVSNAQRSINAMRALLKTKKQQG